MKQVFIKKGAVCVEDAPVPTVGDHSVLVDVTASLISTGTELATLQAASSPLWKRALRSPGNVKKVFGSLKNHGFKRTLALIHAHSEQWQAIGYSCAGLVKAVGKNVTGFQAGDRVACAGAGWANHAELISVPSTLCVPIPDTVADESAAFVTLGAIALQGVRRADPKLGETVCVIGLGLIGQLTVQLLAASGCVVIGIDPDPSRVALAKKHGLAIGGTAQTDIIDALKNHTAGHMADITLITASTSSNEPLRHAFELTRKKGRVVLVGAVGMAMERSPFYEKEQDFLISCSYGPGRYDPLYEQQAQDYPYAYVRWTENRNMRAFLELIAREKVSIDPLWETSVPITEAEKAYAMLAQPEGARPLSILLTYPSTETPTPSASPLPGKTTALTGRKIRVGFIGVGEFARSTHVPNVLAQSSEMEIAAICAATSASALTVGRQTKAAVMTTNPSDVFNHAEIDAVILSTRHHNHAALAIEALKKGKHVYLEKPLALTREECDALEKTVAELNGKNVFMVGFNRVFSPYAQPLLAATKERQSPLMMEYRVNAGRLPATHWTQTAEGGGRLRGEACHMIDFFQALTGSPLVEASITPLHAHDAGRPDENFSAHFSFRDGSVGTLIYTSIGHSSFPKERIEIHWDGKSAVLDDFKSITFFGGSLASVAGEQNKGHNQALKTFVAAMRSGQAFPIPWERLISTTRAAIELDDAVWGRIPVPPCAE